MFIIAYLLAFALDGLISNYHSFNGTRSVRQTTPPPIHRTIQGLREQPLNCPGLNVY